MSISSAHDLVQRLEECGKRLKNWSYQKFGNIQRRIKDLQEHIAIMNSQAGGFIRWN